MLHCAFALLARGRASGNHLLAHSYAGSRHSANKSVTGDYGKFSHYRH